MTTGGPSLVRDGAHEAQLDLVEASLHARSWDWAPWHPEAVPVTAGWHELGCPHVLMVRTRRRLATEVVIERTWFGPGIVPRQDEAALPRHLVEEPISSRVSDHEAWAAAVLPRDLVSSLAHSGLHDDLVVVATEELRSLPWPFLPVPPLTSDGTAGEWLTAYAAVTLLPSLSWGTFLARRARNVRPTSTRLLAYVDPNAHLDTLRGWLEDRPGGVPMASSLVCLQTQLLVSRPAAVVIATHGTLTDDGSVDLRDDNGHRVSPEALSEWRLPPIVLLSGCRTATSNPSAPLHLAEAALLAGASHVIAPTHRTTDEVLDLVLGGILQRLAPSPASSVPASQALQNTLQQVARAYSISPLDPTPWSMVHVGLPGTAGC